MASLPTSFTHSLDELSNVRFVCVYSIHTGTLHPLADVYSIKDYDKNPQLFVFYGITYNAWMAAWERIDSMSLNTSFYIAVNVSGKVWIEHCITGERIHLNY